MRFVSPILVAAALAVASTSLAVEPAKPAAADSVRAGAPIVYFEIAGPDGAALSKFYGDIFAWKIGGPLSTIDPASTGGLSGGIRQDPAEKLIYLGVDDINATLAKIVAAGGKTVVPRMVVPGVVTFAIFTDPAGNRMGLAENGSFGAAKGK